MFKRGALFKAFPAALIACALCTGCWDKVELENRAFVNAVGIDPYNKEESGAVIFGGVSFGENSGSESGGENRFLASVSLPSMETLTGKGSEDAKGKTVKLAASTTLSSAMRLVDLSTSQKPYFGHVKAAVLGDGVLENAELLREAVDALERNREIGRKLMILAADGQAKDILEGQTNEEPLLGMFLSNFYKSGQSAAATAFRLNLDALARRLITEDGCAVIPKISLEEKALRLGGAAVIADYRLAGWLDDRQTRGYLWALGMGKGAQVAASVGDTAVPLSVNRCASRLSFSQGEDGITCHIRVRASGTVEEFKMGENALMGYAPELSRAYEQVIAEEINGTFRLMQNYSADGFGLKERLRKLEPDMYARAEEDWAAAFQAMAVETDVRVRITGTGAIA